jgi:UDP-N-acetyl-D-glucosamine dehydrogenase
MESLVREVAEESRGSVELRPQAAAPVPASRTGLIAVVGLGYVGLPSALALHQAGRSVLGIDVSARRLTEIRAGECDLTDADRARLGVLLAQAARLQGKRNP